MSLNKKDNETTGIRVALVIEVLGKPPEHLTDTLEKIIESLDKEKGVKVISKDIKKPIEIKDKKEFYTSFAEIEIEVEEILYLAIVMFKYMPSHIEIISPELIALTNSGWNDIFNELTRRLHGYDEIAKVLQIQNFQLKEKLKESTNNSNNKEEVKEKPKGKKK
ncbi:MAG: hypothetical protein ACP5NZ_00880 [Nanobdellota archaeon]